MKRKFFIRTLIISLSAMLLFGIAAGILIGTYTQRMLKDDLIRFSDVIKDEAQKENVNLEGLVSFESSLKQSFRISVVDSSGNMLADSFDGEEYENHLNRPEIKSALENKPKFVKRRSETLNKRLMYYAVPFSYTHNGITETCVLRVAIEMSAVTNALLSSIPFLAVIIAALVIALSITHQKYNNSMFFPIAEIKGWLHKINSGNFEKLSVGKDNEEFLPVINELNEIGENFNSLNKVRSEFFANASHELNTPLTYISGYAELMEKGLLTDKDKILECGGKIREQTFRMDSLITDMLKLSRLENSQDISFEDVNLKDLINNVAETLKLQAEKSKVKINVYCYEENIISNEKLLKDILTNLMQNAVKYNKQNGSVDITVKKEERTLTITVSDNGIGIAKENQARLFERFYRVDKGRSKESGGTGLGLAIVKHSVQKLSGTITVESAYGKGSKFIVSLPVNTN